MVLTTIVAVVFGGWIRQAIVQRDVSKQLERLGLELMMGEAPQWLSWLPSSVLNYDGGHYFCPVVAAYIGENKSAFSDEGMLLVAKFKKLESLILSGASVTDEGISSIRSLTSLQTLDLSDSMVTGMYLSDFRSLRVLALSNTALAEQHFIAICKLPTLSSLDVRNCRNITKAGLEGFVGSSTLEDLDLSDCRRISQDGLDFISRIHSLKAIKMDRTGITSITNLTNVHQLNSISLTSNTLHIEDAIEFAGRFNFELKNSGPEILPLGFSYGSYDYDCIKVITTLAGQPWAGDLQRVKLEGFVGLDSHYLASFEPCIVELSLARSQLKEELFHVISTWPKLTNLNLEGTNLSNKDLEQVSLCGNLSCLELDNTAIDDDGLNHLRGLTELTQLELNDTGATQASLPVLCGFTKLERLELPFIPEAEDLLKLLTACPNLNKLSCYTSKVKRRVFSSYYTLVPDFEVDSEYGVTLGDAQFTAEQLERLLNLRSAYRLSGRNLDDSHCKIIKNVSSLASLDLSGSRITDAGLAKLAERRRWKDLDFTNTQVTLQGLDQLRKSGTRVATLWTDAADDTRGFVSVIRELKGLTTLGYPLSNLSKADASEILAWCADNPLELYDTHNDSGLLNFDLMPWMLGKTAYATDATNVHLNGALIDDARLSEFTPSSNLEHVTVSNAACSSSLLIEKLLECKGLVALKLYEVPLDVEAILKLEKLKRLRTLELVDCGITDRHLPAFNELSQLHELILDSNQITGEGLHSFALAQQLDYFSLKNNPLSPSAKVKLQELTQQFPSLQVEP